MINTPNDLHLQQPRRQQKHRQQQRRRHPLAFLGWLLICLVMVTSAGAIDAAEKTPRVMFIGDSIASGYGRTVHNVIGDQAVVVRAPGNASSTHFALSKPRIPKKKKKAKRPPATNAAGGAQSRRLRPKY